MPENSPVREVVIPLRAAPATRASGFNLTLIRMIRVRTLARRRKAAACLFATG